MEFVNGLRSDTYFRGQFMEPRLLRSTWLTEDGDRYLEFDVFTPLKTPEAEASGAAPIPETGWDTIDESHIDDEDSIDFEDVGEASERTS